MPPHIMPPHIMPPHIMPPHIMPPHSTPPHTTPVSMGGRPMPPEVPTHERPIGTNLLTTEKAARTARSLHITPVSMGGRPMPPGVAHEGPIGITSKREAEEPRHGIKPATK